MYVDHASLFEHLGDAVAMMDLDGRVIAWNRASERLFGFTRDEALALTLGDLFPTAAREAGFVAQLLEAATEGRVEREAWRVHRDGTEIWVSTVMSAVRSADGALVGFAVTQRDHSAAREARLMLLARAREVEQSNKGLQAFAGVASHDLQEPLRKLRIFSDRLRTRFASELTPDAAAIVSRIGATAERMQLLVDGILAYATLARPTRASVPVDLNRIAAEVRADLEPRLEAIGARVELGELPTVPADATQMQQLLQNLLGNAVKFARKDAPLVVRVTDASTADAWGFRVEDNGIGFDPQYAERIFGLLQRLHGRHEYDGSGIGLAICQRIVESYGGTITATGHPGVGACFTVALPRGHGREG